MGRNSPFRSQQAVAPSESTTTSGCVAEIGTPANESLNCLANHQADLDQACLALLASRVFSAFLPEQQLSAETDRAAKRLANLLAKHANTDDAHTLGQETSKLVERIAFTSRGKRLHQRGEDLTRHLSVITRAMLTGQCLSGEYNLRNRELHPYGLVVREPKVYLLAAEHPASSNNSTDAPIKQYLLNRFDSLAISTTPSRVPESFNINDYIDHGHMDVFVQELKKALSQQFELVLRFREQSNQPLIRDLQDFALGNQQQAFIKTDDNSDYLLTVPNQAPTYALCEWLLGRMDRVEILEPVELRHYLKEKLKVTYELYADSTPLQITEHSSLPAGLQTQATAENDTEHETLEPATARRSQYATNSSGNRLVARLVMRILANVRIDQQLLIQNALWSLDALFDGEVREYIIDDDVDGFQAWVSKQSALLEIEEPDEQDPLLVNVNDAGALLRLNDVETDLLCLAALIHVNSPLRSALSLLNDNPNEYDAYEIISLITGHSAEAVAAALKDTATLRKSGLIGRCPVSIVSINDVLKMPSVICTNLFDAHESQHGMISGLAIASPATQLGQEDLEHLSQQLSVAEAYLLGASKQQAVGCNILLWGPPGTGKTQLARYLAKSLSLQSMEIRSVEQNGNALRELERMCSYTLMQVVLERTDNSLIIFDEAENILDPPYSVRSEISKASLNELLEGNPVPAIWISNSVEDVDPAYLRRFDVVIEVPVPEFAAKKRVAQRILNDVPMNEELLDAFLERHEVGPAFLKKVKRVAGLTGATTQESVGTLATSLLNNEIAMSGGLPVSLPDSTGNDKTLATLPYDFTLINASEDLGALADTLDADVNIKFCLYGAPGTGKTAWAKKLAEQLHKPAHVVQASDINDKYVGGSEKNIARAFAQAEKQAAVLIFDEVDSYLNSRDSNVPQHAISSINQFLISLENYRGIVVCSTNLMDNLDKAALRRFDFKVKFNYLSAPQANQLLLSTAKLLGMQLAPKDLVTHNCSLSANTFAPGDFAVVLKRSQIRGGEATLEQLCADIKAEAAIREGTKSLQPFGFQ